MRRGHLALCASIIVAGSACSPGAAPDVPEIETAAYALGMSWDDISMVHVVERPGPWTEDGGLVSSTYSTPPRIEYARSAGGGVLCREVLRHEAWLRHGDAGTVIDALRAQRCGVVVDAARGVLAP